MPSNPSSEAIKTIERIKSEIETLRQQHLEALKAATYLGMTREQEKVLEERRVKITKLMRELTELFQQISELNHKAQGHGYGEN